MVQDAPPLEQQAVQAREHQLRFIVSVLTLRWRMIAVFTIAAMLLYGTVGLLRQEKKPLRYRAQSRVLVTQSFWDKDALKGVGGTPLTPFDAQTLAKRISIQRLAGKIVRAIVQQDVADGGPWCGITTDQEYAGKADEIAANLNLTVADPQSGVITIEVADASNRDEASRIAEFAVRAFVDETQQLRVDEDERAHDAIQTRLQELQQELYAAEASQWEYKKAMGFQTYGSVGEELTKVYEELNEKRALKEETATKLTEIESELKTNSEQLPDALGNVTDAVVTEMLTDLDKLLQEQLTMSVVYNAEYPGLKEIEEDIAEKKQAVLEAVRKVDQSAGDGTNVWKQRQNLYRQQLDLHLSLTGIEIRMAALQRMIEEMIPKIPELANKNMEYERLVKDAEQVREQFNKLREREFDLRTALGRESGQVARHESVVASALPVRGMGGPWTNFLIGALVGFVVGFGLAVMLEIMDTSIRSIDDITNYIGLEVIGMIPKMRFGKPKGSPRRKGTYVPATSENQIDACIVTQHDPKSPISEAYRTLRTNFQFATINEKPRTVMVTSAVPGEGKTTTAVNLAVTMADRGIRVLIVDTDLRRPNVHRVLRMERGPGLADVLRDGVDLHSVVRETRIENLWIVSSGRVPPNPSELIGSDRMEQLVGQLGREFDLVVCDAPSILVVTDPVLLATRVDTVVIVVSVNNARRETVQRAYKLLQTAKARVAGVVLNGLDATRRHYYYYYYYYEDGADRSQRRWYHL